MELADVLKEKGVDSIEAYEAKIKAERRKTPRTPASAMVHVTSLGRDGSPMDFTSGQALNISEGGMRIRLISYPLPVDSLVRLSFHLDGQAVEMEGRVIYVENSGGFVMGVQFFDVGVEVEKALKNFLNGKVPSDWNFTG